MNTKKEAARMRRSIKKLAVFSRKDEAQERIDKYSIRPDDYSVVALNVTQDGACPYCKESLK